MEGYDPTAIDQKWQAYWRANDTFRTPTDGAGLPAGEKRYCLDMFPYPSGAGLHVGHPLGYTATDIYARWLRHKGYAVLHPMGFDSFGLPAEQHAVSTGEHPAIVTSRNITRFTEQLRRLGLAYDWSRTVTTSDPDYYRWTQWIFIKLFDSWFDREAGKARPISELPVPEEVRAGGPKAVEAFVADRRLAYYAEASVNWCPALGTVLANEEVIDGRSERGGHEVVRRPMKQWMLRITEYSERLVADLDGLDWPEAIKEQQRNWIGIRRGTEVRFAVSGADGGDSDAEILVFTTRPDTLFGVTFVALAPEHPLVRAVTRPDRRSSVERYVAESARMSDVERTTEARPKTGVATGGYVEHPVTAEPIPVFVADYVLSGYGTGAVMGVPAHDERDFAFAKVTGVQIRPVVGPPAGTEPETVRRVGEGSAVWTAAGIMLPCSAGAAAGIELDGLSDRDAASLVTRWLESRGRGRAVTNYKLRDWLFSRQRYWGEPIPVIHWDDGSVTAVPEESLPLVLPEVDDYKPADTGESPLARATEWLAVADPSTGRRGRRETNTMPQWAGSCWYYLRFVDPGASARPFRPEAEAAWCPVDVYVGGAEHAVLHLLYARFWHKVLFDLGHVSTPEPFRKLVNQGMIVAYAYEDRRGAVVPADAVEEASPGEFVSRQTGEAVTRSVRKMSKSLRNVVDPIGIVDEYGADVLRTYLMFMAPLEATRPWDPKAIAGNVRFLRRCHALVRRAAAAVSGSSDPGVVRSLHRTIRKVTDDVAALRYNTALSSLMEFVNVAFDAPLSRDDAATFVVLLAPFAPHSAEELWETLGRTPSVSAAPWPEHDEGLVREDDVEVVIQVRGKKRSSATRPVTSSDEELKEAVVAALSGTPYAVASTDRFIVVRGPAGPDGRPGPPRLVNVLPSS